MQYKVHACSNFFLQLICDSIPLWLGTPNTNTYNIGGDLQNDSPSFSLFQYLKDPDILST